MSAMNYSQTLDYLYDQLPMFHRIGAAAYKADLSNTIALCKLLGNPENKFRSIHVAGTNGKGSSSHMLAAVLQEAGYKTGLYTSPHLRDFRERIRINGKFIPKGKVMRFVEQHRQAFDTIRPSFFEWTVGLAFNYFAEQKVDVAVIEVGLGGRLDSTNVVTPLVSLITSISFDHMALLGDTLPKIAAEKAGIIKPRVPVVVSQSQQQIKSVFVQKAKACKAPILFADEKLVALQSIYFPQKERAHFIFDKAGKRVRITSDLTGTYQAHNLAGVLVTLDALQPVLPVSAGAMRRGLAHVKELTGLRGRWEVISRKPRIICDTGHNEDGIREVMACVNREFEARVAKGKLHVVFGAVNDKDVSKVFGLLKKNDHFRGADWYFCKPAIPRGMDTQELVKAAGEKGLAGAVYNSVKKALQAAKRAARPGELVLVCGSTFTVAEVV